MIEGKIATTANEEWWGYNKVRTPEKEVALVEFRLKLKDIATEKQLKNDIYCKRWLIARQFNVDQAVEMFKNSMSLREKMEADKLIAEYTPPEVISKFMTGGDVGHDKEGSVLRIEPWGYLDMKGIMYSTKKSDLEKSKLLQCEKHLVDLEAMSEKLGKPCTGLTVVFDMDNVGSKHMWKPGLDMYLYLVQVLEDNYPEMMKRLFVINAPTLFPVLYKLVKPLLSEDMKNKIFVLGSDFKDTLMEYIDAEELPAYLGGTKTGPDGDPKCSDLICHGGEVPKEYYLENTEDFETMETITVGSGDKIYIEYEVEGENCFLKWEYKTEEHDIGFGVFRKNGDEWEEIIPIERKDCSVMTLDGSYKCKDPGTYALCFDNSFSMMTSKNIRYTADVMDPEEEKTKEDLNKMIKNSTWDELSSTLS